MPKYYEKEIIDKVYLCDRFGNLNPSAIGWSRKPLHICNLKGHIFRKKKWNYWCILTDKFLFSLTLSNIDYIGLAFAYFIDFVKKEMIEKTVILPFGIGCILPDEVEKDIEFKNKNMNFSIKYLDEEIKVNFVCPSMQGKKVLADVIIKYPKNHETLNVVVPWSKTRFQFTSKQNTLPAKGSICVDDKIYEFKQNNSFACLDYGRGVWKYNVMWNWASFSGWEGENLIGANFGGKWTDRTLSNENGICFNGKLYKISEDVNFIYNRKNFMQTWTIKTDITDSVDLKFTPFFERKSYANLIFLKTQVHQMFGYFSGILSFNNQKIKINNIIGWAEEHIGKW